MIAPNADEIEITVHDRVEFFWAGANFERVLCPNCGAEIPMAWWTERMTEDYRDGFMLAEYETPCCNSPHTLHELNYDWPQGLERFEIAARNPSMGRLSEEHERELEETLGTKLRVIYRHI